VGSEAVVGPDGWIAPVIDVERAHRHEGGHRASDHAGVDAATIALVLSTAERPTIASATFRVRGP
jgi:hypothetical protein